MGGASCGLDRGECRQVGDEHLHGCKAGRSGVTTKQHLSLVAKNGQFKILEILCVLTSMEIAAKPLLVQPVVLTAPHSPVERHCRLARPE